ncbi:MAG: zinc ribbon domain-containing protein [Candidatus Helarchaeota archaeon]|nr:zinc ribbon domain-containing protein [Candidatus Helarchaeota archaeon]
MAKTEFITEKIPVKGTPCSFQIASVRKKWAMRVIDNTNNKVLKVVKLKKVTSAVITDNIRDIVGRKYSLKDNPIDEMDLGAKMATLLKQVDDFQKTGALPTPSTVQAKPKPAIRTKQTASKPDSFWSTYSTAISQPVELTNENVIQPEISTETPPTEPVISFGQNHPTHPAPTQPAQASSELDEVFSVLGVNCPNCSAEVDYDAEVCPNCGTPIE